MPISGFHVFMTLPALVLTGFLSLFGCSSDEVPGVQPGGPPPPSGSPRNGAATSDRPGAEVPGVEGFPTEDPSSAADGGPYTEVPGVEGVPTEEPSPSDHLFDQLYQALGEELAEIESSLSESDKAERYEFFNDLPTDDCAALEVLAAYDWVSDSAEELYGSAVKSAQTC